MKFEPRRRKTFASVYDTRRNNFDFIRFVLASLVIWSHCFVLAGHPVDWFFKVSGQIDGGSLAVDGFFVLSGFLVTQSWVSCPRVSIFAQKRFLRIVPALIVALAFGAFVIGPLNSSLSVIGYFRSSEPWLHFLGVALNGYLFLPSVFSSNPVPRLLNAPLWSLRYEMLCYAGVALLGLNRTRSWRASIIFGFVVSWLSCFIYSHIGQGVPSIPQMAARLAACFSAGMLFYVFRSQVPYDKRLAAIAAMIATVTFVAGGFRPAFPIAGGYLLLYVAFARALPVSGFGRHGDFSYGLYVLGYPIQQTIVRLVGPGMPVGLFFAISFLGTLALAFASWHLIEAPALARKPRGAIDVSGADSIGAGGESIPWGGAG